MYDDVPIPWECKQTQLVPRGALRRGWCLSGYGGSFHTLPFSLEMKDLVWPGLGIRATDAFRSVTGGFVFHHLISYSHIRSYQALEDMVAMGNSKTDML